MIIYYNSRLNIFGVLQSNGLLKVVDDYNGLMVLTNEWEAVSYL